MRNRIIFSIVFIPIIVVAVYARVFKSLPFFAFMMLVAVLASWEVHDLFQRAFSAVPHKLLFILPSATIIANGYLKSFVTRPGGAILLYGISATIIFLFVCTLIYRGDLRCFLLLLGSYIYTGVFPLLIVALKWERSGTILIYFFLLLVWVNDSAAYFAGTFFGKRRGIFKISPNKSLEGYIGGVIITFTAAIIFRALAGERLPINYIETNLSAALLSITAPAGDLIESMLKRRAGVKDSSKIFPGFGGILDIFDSVLFSAPFYYCLIKVLL